MSLSVVSGQLLAVWSVVSSLWSVVGGRRGRRIFSTQYRQSKIKNQKRLRSSILVGLSLCGVTHFFRNRIGNIDAVYYRHHSRFNRHFLVANG